MPTFQHIKLLKHFVDVGSRHGHFNGVLTSGDATSKKTDRSTWLVQVHLPISSTTVSEVRRTRILWFSCHRKSTSHQRSTTCSNVAQAGSTSSSQISSVQIQVMRQHLQSAAATCAGTASVHTWLCEVSKELHRWDSIPPVESQKLRP